MIYALVILGLIIDIIFLVLCYLSEGFPIWLAGLLSLVLTVFSAFCYQYRKEKKFFLMFVLSFIYIILCTHAGQYFLLQDVRSIDSYKVSINDQNRKKIESIEKEIKILERKIALKPEYEVNYLNQIKELESSKSEYGLVAEDKKIKIDRYRFYSGGNSTAERLLILFFEIMFSLITASIAPLALSKINKKAKTGEKEEFFVQSIFSDIRSKTSEFFVDSETVCNAAQRKGIDLTHQDYIDFMRKLAVAQKVKKVDNRLKPFSPYTSEKECLGVLG